MGRKKETWLISLVAMLLFSILMANVPLSSGSPDTVLAAPDVVDPGLTPGAIFSVEITVAQVTMMFGYEFVLGYDTTILTATSFTSYDPFTDVSPSKINDTAGYVALAASFPIPEYFGLDTWDPVPIARIDFEVDSDGYGYSPLDLYATVIVDVYGEVIPHSVRDGRFVNKEVHDVAVTDVTANRTLVKPGRPISINVTVYNEGTWNETFDITVYYDDTLIEPTPTQTVTALVPKTLRTVTFVWNTTSVADGTYQIKANATLAGDVNPANNEKIDGSVIVNSADVHDIAITSVTASPSMLLVNQSASITVTVKNDGNIEETFDASVYYFNATADYPIATQTVFLMDGASKTLTYIWDTTGVFWGNYTIKASAPLAGDVNPANNEKIDGQVGVGLHDIAVISVNLLNPLYPVVVIGDLAEFEVKVRNQGIQNATFSVTMYRNETVIETQDVADLLPGRVKTLSFIWNTTVVYPGNYTIKAIAGPMYGEVNTADNTHFLDLIPPVITVVGELHDIAVTDVSAPSIIVAGSTASIKVTVQNLGTVAEAFNATLYYDTVLIGTERDQYVPAPPAPESSMVLTFNWNTTGVPLGTYTIKANVTVIPGDINATNNAKTTQVTIATHDVAVISVTANPTQVAVGQQVTINATVQNQGNFTESFTVTVKYDDATIIEIPVTGLSAGASRSLPFKWSTTDVTPGTYTLTANASVVEGEIDIDDNVKTTQVTLKISSAISISANPTTLTIGESTTLNGSITQNPGAGVTVTIWYRVEGATTWNILNTTQTGIDGKYSYVWTPTTVGTYEVKASWAGNATTSGDESDPPYPTIAVQEAAAARPLNILPYAVAGIAGVIVIAIVYVLKIRKPKST